MGVNILHIPLNSSFRVGVIGVRMDCMYSKSLPGDMMYDTSSSFDQTTQTIFLPQNEGTCPGYVSKSLP